MDYKMSTKGDISCYNLLKLMAETKPNGKDFFMNYIFAARLVNLRTKAGISQKELAVLLKVTPSTLSNYENGIYLPPLSKACILAKELHTSLDYLAGLTSINFSTHILTRIITPTMTFYELIKFLASLENNELLEIMHYAQYLKYRRSDSPYEVTSNVSLVAEDAPH